MTTKPASERVLIPTWVAVIVIGAALAMCVLWTCRIFLDLKWFFALLGTVTVFGLLAHEYRDDLRHRRARTWFTLVLALHVAAVVALCALTGPLPEKIPGVPDRSALKFAGAVVGEWLVLAAILRPVLRAPAR